MSWTEEGTVATGLSLSEALSRQAARNFQQRDTGCQCPQISALVEWGLEAEYGQLVWEHGPLSDFSN